MTGAAFPVSHLRLDIQALRGLAVVLVVAYHAGIAALPAGYLGVDVFFVISGFLITSLIAKAIDRGDFSYRDFYFRRAKRLLPAAYFVIVLTIVAAPFFISATALAEMRDQVWGAITFSANFVLMGQSGYFDGAAESKPFLHFWSLAIEEQYYLAMPFLLTLLNRKAWLASLCAIAVISFAACAWMVQSNPSAAFYLPVTRAWELALGSLIAIAPIGQIPAKVRSVTRVPALIVLLCIPAFPTPWPHPGLDALLVTVATAIIIVGANGSRFERSMPVRIIARVGDISYSLYLVHWPILVFTRAAWLEDAPSSALYLAVVISFLVSILVYRFIEIPFRQGFSDRRRGVVGGLFAASILIAASPVALADASPHTRDFAEVRRNNYGLGIDCTVNERRPFTGRPSDACRTTTKPKLLVWGDSYAMAWTSVLMGPLKDFGLEQITRGACDPLLGMARFPKASGEAYSQQTARECIETHNAILAYAIAQPSIEIVALAGRFSTVLSNSNLMLVETTDGYDVREVSIDLAATGLSNLADQLQNAGKRVVFLSPPPADGSEIGECLERRESGKVTFGRAEGCDLSVLDVTSTRKDTWAMLALASQRSNVPVISMDSFLCDEVTCRTMLDGKFIYRDSGHLAYEGAALIGERSDVAQDIVKTAR